MAAFARRQITGGAKMGSQAASDEKTEELLWFVLIFLAFSCRFAVRQNFGFARIYTATYAGFALSRTQALLEIFGGWCKGSWGGLKKQLSLLLCLCAPTAEKPKKCLDTRQGFACSIHSDDVTSYQTLERHRKESWEKKNFLRVFFFFSTLLWCWLSWWNKFLELRYLVFDIP